MRDAPRFTAPQLDAGDGRHQITRETGGTVLAVNLALSRRDVDRRRESVETEEDYPDPDDWIGLW